MKFEQPHDDARLTPEAQSEKTSASEKVILAKFENELKGLGSTDTLPEFSTENLSTEGRANLTKIMKKAVQFHTAQNKGPNLIVAAKILELAVNSNIEQEGDESLWGSLNTELAPKVRSVFDKSIDKGNIEEALELKRHFTQPEFQADLEMACETKIEGLRKFAKAHNTYGDYRIESDDQRRIRAVFLLMPQLEHDEKLKEEVRNTFKKGLEYDEKSEKEDRKGAGGRSASAIAIYPRSFFNFEEDIRPVAVKRLKVNVQNYLSEDYYRRSQYKIDASHTGYIYGDEERKNVKPFKDWLHLTDEEMEIVVNEVLDKEFSSHSFDAAKELAREFGIEKKLEAKATELYKQKLATVDKGDGYTINQLRKLVPKEIEKQEEIVNLKRNWVLQNISGNYGLDSVSESGIKNYKEEWNLDETFLALPDTQNQLRDQLLKTLGYGNWDKATALYNSFLTSESQTQEFQQEIEKGLLSALEKSSYKVSSDEKKTQLLDILSEEFKHSPEFKQKAISILSQTLQGGSIEDYNAALKKLNFSESEIREAKENALLNSLSYGRQDGSRQLNFYGDQNAARVKGIVEKIQPDEDTLKAVREKINQSVISKGNLEEIEKWMKTAPLLGLPAEQIFEQKESKETIYRNIEDLIKEGKLNDAVKVAKDFKLSPEDLKNISPEDLNKGVVWWLTKENEGLSQAIRYESSWKFVEVNIENFIKFFDIPQENLIQDPDVRKLAGSLLLKMQAFGFNRTEAMRATLEGTLLTTEEDMLEGIDDVTDLIIGRKIENQLHYFQNLRKILPSIPEGFADHRVIDKYFQNIKDYRMPKKRGYREGYYGREEKTILDYMNQHAAALETFESVQEIFTRTLEYLVNKNEFDAALDLLDLDKEGQYIDRASMQNLLLPEYIKRLTEGGEREANHFAEVFKIKFEDISNEKLTEAYKSLFISAVQSKNVDGIISNSKRVTFTKEFLNTPEIKAGIEAAFITSLSGRGFENAIQLVENGLLDESFIRSEQVREAARTLLPNMLSNGSFENIIKLNSQLSLGITSQEMIALDPTKVEFFERLKLNFPKLAEKCFGSLDALFSIWPYVHLLKPEVLDKFPFLAEALQENERFGVKLLLKFESLDKLSQANIATLYKNKSDILNEKGDIDVESRDFRIAMQSRLETYRRNPEILAELKKTGINVEEWLNHEEEVYFELGRDTPMTFSEALITPIERMEETINTYVRTHKEGVAEYKNELTTSMVPLKNLEELQKELEGLERQKQIALDANNQKKADGIDKGILNIKTQIENPKMVSAWDKLHSDYSLLDLVKKDAFKAYQDLKEAELKYVEKEQDDTAPQAQKRKELIKLKAKIEAAKKELKEKISLLDRRINENLDHEMNVLTKVVGEDRADALVREIQHERLGEIIDHYNSDRDAIINVFAEKQEKGLDGQAMKIEVWNRNPNKDLYLGNYTDCCIRIDSSHMGAECTIADYMTDVGVQIVSINDEKKNMPVVAAWCWMGHDDNDEVAFVIDNIEANTDYSSTYKSQMEAKLREYLQNYAKKVGARLVQGTSNNDLVVAKMNSAYFKVGGYNRPSGYYLEGEDNRANDGGFEEHEQEHWGGENEEEEN